MYEDNFAQVKPIGIGIDHKVSILKTQNHIFSNGVSRCSDKPPVVKNSLYYEFTLTKAPKIQTSKRLPLRNFKYPN